MMKKGQIADNVRLNLLPAWPPPGFFYKLYRLQMENGYLRRYFTDYAFYE
jgi:hypothetical protein